MMYHIKYCTWHNIKIGKFGLAQGLRVQADLKSHVLTKGCTFFASITIISKITIIFSRDNRIIYFSLSPTPSPNILNMSKILSEILQIKLCSHSQ